MYNNKVHVSSDPAGSFPRRGRNVCFVRRPVLTSLRTSFSLPSKKTARKPIPLPAHRRRCRIYNIKASPLMAGRHKLWKVFQTLGALACALIVADGLLTPVVTVTSAVEGIGLSVWRFNGNSGTVSLDTGTPGDPENSGRTCTLSAAILVVVFAIQMSGSQRIGYIYSPVLVTWLVYIGVTGVIAIAEHGRGSALTLWNPIHLRRFWTQGSFRGVAAVRAAVAAPRAGHAVA